MQPQSQIPGRTSAPTTRTRQRESPQRRELPPYGVVLENSNHSFAFVIETLQKVFGYGWFRSMRLALQAHLRGRAVVWIGPLEHAEFKLERIQGVGPDQYLPYPLPSPLHCLIEPLKV